MIIQLTCKITITVNQIFSDTRKNLNTRIAPIDRSRLAEQHDMFETDFDDLEAENNWLTVDNIFLVSQNILL